MKIFLIIPCLLICSTVGTSVAKEDNIQPNDCKNFVNENNDCGDLETAPLTAIDEREKNIFQFLSKNMCIQNTLYTINIPTLARDCKCVKENTTEEMQNNINYSGYLLAQFLSKKKLETAFNSLLKEKVGFCKKHQSFFLKYAKKGSKLYFKKGVEKFLENQTPEIKNYVEEFVSKAKYNDGTKGIFKKFKNKIIEHKNKTPDKEVIKKAIKQIIEVLKYKVDNNKSNPEDIKNKYKKTSFRNNELTKSFNIYNYKLRSEFLKLTGRDVKNHIENRKKNKVKLTYSRGARFNLILNFMKIHKENFLDFFTKKLFQDPSNKEALIDDFIQNILIDKQKENCLKLIDSEEKKTISLKRYVAGNKNRLISLEDLLQFYNSNKLHDFLDDIADFAKNNKPFKNDPTLLKNLTKENRYSFLRKVSHLSFCQQFTNIYKNKLKGPKQELSNFIHRWKMPPSCTEVDSSKFKRFISFNEKYYDKYYPQNSDPAEKKLKTKIAQEAFSKKINTDILQKLPNDDSSTMQLTKAQTSLSLDRELEKIYIDDKETKSKYYYPENSIRMEALSAQPGFTLHGGEARVVTPAKKIQPVIAPIIDEENMEQQVVENKPVTPVLKTEKEIISDNQNTIDLKEKGAIPESPQEIAKKSQQVIQPQDIYNKSLPAINPDNLFTRNGMVNPLPEKIIPDNIKKSLLPYPNPNSELIEKAPITDSEALKREMDEIDRVAKEKRITELEEKLEEMNKKMAAMEKNKDIKPTKETKIDPSNYGTFALPAKKKAPIQASGNLSHSQGGANQFASSGHQSRPVAQQQRRQIQPDNIPVQKTNPSLTESINSYSSGKTITNIQSPAVKKRLEGATYDPVKKILTMQANPDDINNLGVEEVAKKAEKCPKFIIDKYVLTPEITEPGCIEIDKKKKEYELVYYLEKEKSLEEGPKVKEPKRAIAEIAKKQEKYDELAKQKHELKVLLAKLQQETQAEIKKQSK